MEYYQIIYNAKLEVSTKTTALTELQMLLEGDSQLKINVSCMSSNIASCVEHVTWFESCHMQMHQAYKLCMDLLAGNLNAYDSP
jgi:hypothetical protein